MGHSVALSNKVQKVAVISTAISAVALTNLENNCGLSVCDGYLCVHKIRS